MKIYSDEGEKVRQLERKVQLKWKLMKKYWWKKDD